MLSISNIGSRQAGSYYGKDGYYVRMDDTDNTWCGKLKDKLDLPDGITKEDFDELVKETEKRAGIDLCFSAPKSVSVAMCMNEQTSVDMLEAHHNAVEKVLAQIEDNEIGTRITKNKVTEHVKTGNMICGKFNHYVSRAQDPQLHTHCVILNKTLYNNRFYAIDNPSLYQNKMLYGQLYRNALVTELLQKGYEVAVTNREKGFFELTGISQETMDHFSSRRKEIVQQLKKWDAESAMSAAKAALLTREAKKQKDIKILMRSWKETLTAMGDDQIQKAKEPIVPTKEEITVNFERAIRRMNRSSFAFTEREFRKVALAHGVATGLTKEQFEALFHQEKSQEIMSLGQRLDGRDNKAYYCTKKNYEMEREIFQEVLRTQNTMAAVPAKAVKDYLLNNATDENGKFKLSGQQRDAVEFIATTKDQYCAIQGLAGTGKTYMLDYARQVLEANGYEVKGACIAGRAANGLQKDARIQSTTLHSFLNRLEKEAGHLDLDEDYKEKGVWILDGLKPGGKKEIWVIDESSMVDNVAMRYLIKAADLKQAKVCFVGDKQQLLPVGVGNAFANMVEKKKISCLTLDEIRRQKDPKQLQSVIEAVKGDINKSLKILEDKGSIQTVTDRKDRLSAIVSEYASLPREERERTVVLTAANQDRKDLNRKIRRQLKEIGELQEGIKFQVKDAGGSIYNREFARGDKVIFLQRDLKLGVDNGQTGFVEGIEGDKVTICCGDGKEAQTIQIDLKEYNYIDHGYAMTTHKAQGITEDHVIIHLDSSQKLLNSRNSYYVDISRARWDVKIFCDDFQKMNCQVKDFAIKLTSDDFLIPKNGESRRLGFSNLKKYGQEILYHLNDSISDLCTRLKPRDMSGTLAKEYFQEADIVKAAEILKSKPNEPTFNR